PSKMINPDTQETIEDPKEIAAQVVREIDHVITESESKLKADRTPSNAKDSESPPVIPSVTIDPKAFDEFIDTIWPDSAIK
ncbi:MAG: hypothetical protein M9962_15710, partial [Oligoflexia bacterium]|nr:hypothetical protein [Oligoflexia bacterium]